MEQDFTHIDDLIVRQLSGQASVDETAQLRRLLEDSSQMRDRYRSMREVWFSAVSREAAAAFDTEAAWERFSQRVEDAQGAPRNPRLKRLMSRVVRYAAVIAVIIAVGLLAYRSGGDSVVDKFADITIEAPLGSRTNFRLPDGTSVWLNAGSTITYSQGFGVVSRHVAMTGEGYFEVARNEELPFVVESGNISVKVLGTVFNFRDYPDDSEASVSLKEGKVELSGAGDRHFSMILTPGQSVGIDKATGQTHLEQLGYDSYSQWTQGLLFFDEAPLCDIARRLERSYCVKIDIANDSLKTQRFYGSFMRSDERIEDVLDALASTHGISYRVEGKNITLY